MNSFTSEDMICDNVYMLVTVNYIIVIKVSKVYNTVVEYVAGFRAAIKAIKRWLNANKENFVQYSTPTQEYGMYLDHKDFIWSFIWCCKFFLFNQFQKKMSRIMKWEMKILVVLLQTQVCEFKLSSFVLCTQFTTLPTNLL